MGKRSSFDRIPKDLYETWDPRAVKPLLPFLEPHTRFAEPCAGNLALTQQLEAAGHVLYWASDIEGRDVTTVVSGVPVTRKVPSADALSITVPLQMADCIITNPVWSRPLLHKLIEHFIANSKFTWILLDAGWSYSKQAAPYMRFCSDIVAVGRVKWIKGTSMTGKDDCQWMRFSHDAEYTIFHAR